MDSIYGKMKTAPDGGRWRYYPLDGVLFIPVSTEMPSKAAVTALVPSALTVVRQLLPRFSELEDGVDCDGGDWWGVQVPSPMDYGEVTPGAASPDLQHPGMGQVEEVGSPAGGGDGSE